MTAAVVSTPQKQQTMGSGTASKTPPRHPRSIPAFLVGVTGLMDLDDAQKAIVQARLRLVFRFLRLGGRACNDDDRSRTLAQSLAKLTIRQSASPTETEKRALDTYERMFRSWPGLGDVPIVVMTNLAPGVDSIATELALDKSAPKDFYVRCPLPFPPEIYREESTFLRGKNAAEDAARQRKFDDLIADVHEENVFFVRLQRDKDTRQSDLAAAFQIERASSEKRALRHDRYYAAGEYLAVMSHLLIAVWDGKPGDPPGTGSVAKARLLGPKDDQLTMSEGIRQAPGGPLLHLFASRPGEDGGTDLPQARFLHPFSVIGDDEPGATILGERQTGQTEPAGTEQQHEIEEANRQALAVQEDRFAIFARIAGNLRQFHGCKPRPDDDDCYGDYQALLRFSTKENGEKKTYEFWKSIRRMSPDDREPPENEETEENEDDGLEAEFSRELRALSYLRFKSTKASRQLKERHVWSLWWIFVLTLTAAGLLHVFAHWHVHPHAEEASTGQGSEVADGPDHASHDAPTEGANHAAKQHVEEREPLLKRLAGLVAALSAIGALSLFFVCRMLKDAERHYDYRALSEAVRLQFYWNLAGLGKSVSANYMHRQRSELDWIRGAVRSVAFPYEYSRERFLLLPRFRQVAVLECVRLCWIEGQRSYFEKTWHAYHHELHAWHRLGAALALAGVGLAAVCILEAWGWPMPPVVVTIFTGVAAIAIWGFFEVRRRNSGLQAHQAEHADKDKRWVKLVHRAVPAPEERPAYRTIWQHAGRSVAGFVARLPLALGLICVVYAITLAIDAVGLAWIPDGKEWRLIFGGIALLAGALAVAWSEKNLLSEFAYQYNTMQSLFREASHRLRLDLAELKRLAKTARPTGSEETPRREKDAYDKKLDEVHEYLYALGKEALDENAEWLLLHRARPLEPVMAG